MKQNQKRILIIIILLIIMLIVATLSTSQTIGIVVVTAGITVLTSLGIMYYVLMKRG